MVCRTTGRTPVRPEARVLARRNMMPRTTSRSTAGPMPAAWLRISDFCSWVRSSLGMCRLARAPKPVEMPYAGTSLWARSSMWARTLATVSSASCEMVTLASWRATATTSSGVTPLEPRVTVSGSCVVTVMACSYFFASAESADSNMGMRTPRSLATSMARS